MGPGHNPPLVECVRVSGAAVVYPTNNKQICAALGLAYPKNVDAGDTVAIQELTNRLSNDFTAANCLSVARGRRDAESALAAFDLYGWRVIDANPTAENGECTRFSIDATTHIVRIEPTTS
jgi:hypothetical protein